MEQLYQAWTNICSPMPSQLINILKTSKCNLMSGLFSAFAIEFARDVFPNLEDHRKQRIAPDLSIDTPLKFASYSNRERTL